MLRPWVSYHISRIIGRNGGKIYRRLVIVGEAIDHHADEFASRFGNDCTHCGEPTYARGHYYMVYDYVWRQVPSYYRNTQLCLDCLQHFLDRPLTVCDLNSSLGLNTFVKDVFFNERGLYDPELNEKEQARRQIIDQEFANATER